MVDVPNSPPPTDLFSPGRLAYAGMALGVGQMGTQVIGAYYGLKAQQNSLRMEALNAQFAANQANLAARAAERDAELIMRAGKQAAAWRGAQAGVEVASFRAATAASGVEVGKGSAGEAERAMRLSAEVDRRTLLDNARMRAQATRESAASQRGASLLGQASAANLRASAGTINPLMGARSAVASGASSLIGQYMTYYGRR